MHHQNQHCCHLEETRCCPHSLRRHGGGCGYISSGQQQGEDSNVQWIHEHHRVCYCSESSQPTAYTCVVGRNWTTQRKPNTQITCDRDLTHEYINTDSCLGGSETKFGDSGLQQDVHRGPMGPSNQTDSVGVVCSATSRIMTEESERRGDQCLCQCGAEDQWRSNPWLCLSPSCFNERNTVVVDVLEELVFEDTEIVETQTMCDGCLENHVMDSASVYCNKSFSCSCNHLHYPCI